MPNLGDITNSLDKITGWVKGQGEKQQDRKAPWNWITGLIVGVVALVAVGLMYWRSWKQGRELAKLKHERDVNEQERERAEVTKAMAINQKKIHTHSIEVQKAKNRIREIDEFIDEEEDKKAETCEKINALKNWRDLDRYLSIGSDDEPGSGAA